MELINASSRAAMIWMLIAFIVTFAVTRGITLMIRAGRGPFRDNVQGGLHIHHLVYGIFSMMLASLAEFAFRPAEPWYDILAVLFGLGAALTLDEYALWLHLDDVYWSKEGRQSVDIVIYAAGIGAVLLLAANPFTPAPGDSRLTFAVSIAINLAFSLVCAVKGKAFMSVCGVLIPVLSIVGGIRLAKPGSPWARWFYRPDGRKLARAQKRELKRAAGRLARWRDSLAGQMTAPALAQAPTRAQAEIEAEPPARPQGQDEGHDQDQAPAQIDGPGHGTGGV